MQVNDAWSARRYSGYRIAHLPVIGRRLFTDGVTRAVHRAPDGREYVIGHDGERVYGT
jgi:hypothetical protein